MYKNIKLALVLSISTFALSACDVPTLRYNEDTASYICPWENAPASRTKKVVKKTVYKKVQADSPNAILVTEDGKVFKGRAEQFTGNKVAN